MSKRKKIIISIISIVVIIGIAISIPLTYMYFAKDEDYSDYKVLGYLPAWVYETKEDLLKYDFSKLTHINFSFSLLDEKSFMPMFPKDHSDKLKILMEYLKENNYDTKVLVSIGGAGASYFCEAAATEPKRDEFSSACLEMINEYGIDGIDIDWEFPGYKWLDISSCNRCDKDYTKLLQAIRDKIGNEKLLTIAGTANLLMIDDYENRKLAKILDFVNVMNYDYNDTNQADFNLTKNCLYTWHLAGFPKTKLNLGVPFYGRSKDKTYQNKGYDKIKELIDSKEATLFEKSSESYVKIGDSKISFDTPSMIKKKAKFTIDYGYGGIFCWQLSTDVNNELVDAMWSEYYSK